MKSVLEGEADRLTGKTVIVDGEGVFGLIRWVPNLVLEAP